MTTEEFLKWEKQSRDTIDVKRCYIDIAGDLVAGTLLSQIIYWFLPNNEGNPKLKVMKDGEYCLAKNQGEWWKECRISVKQYQRARKILIKKGFLKIINSMFAGKRTPHIFLNWNTVIHALEGTDSVIPKGLDRSCPKVAIGKDESALPITETASKKSKAKKNFSLSSLEKKEINNQIEEIVSFYAICYFNATGVRPCVGDADKNKVENLLVDRKHSADWIKNIIAWYVDDKNKKFMEHPNLKSIFTEENINKFNLKK